MVALNVNFTLVQAAPQNAGGQPETKMVEVTRLCVAAFCKKNGLWNNR